MGSKPSKLNVVSNPDISEKARASAVEDQALGLKITQNIHLKPSSPFAALNNQMESTKFQKRQELNRNTEGKVSWNDIPSLFTTKAPANEVSKSIRKYFKLVKSVVK